ncbi:putative histidine kinase protein [Candidatus Terasakiella magnetica]|uniref:histidine kinase n=1 Tax=Candidatus Terasakiella magnetica TaxID=1867952 RepID=A0A1C3RLY2_9PROT|nr:PAS-domain containing protein [Candidatus Terasakiella magnetica]SCA58238.1 putative histidine kinase protein [Candidatus Terasakiella magnetica]
MDSLGALILGMVALAALGVPALFLLWRKNKSLLEERETLGQQTLQLQEVLVGIPDGLYRWNVVNGIENCSARMAVLLDLPKGTQSRYGDILECFDDEAARTLDAAVSSLHNEGMSFDIILPLQGGDDRVVQAVGQRVLSEEGEPLVDLLFMRLANGAIVANGPMARSLQAMTSERDKLVSVLESLPLPIWMRDASGHIIYHNPAAPDSDHTQHIAQRAMEAGREVRERLSLPVGQNARLFEIAEIPLPGGEGFIGIAEDMTSAENMVENAQRGESLLRAALENLVTAIAIFNGDTRLGFYNTAYAQLWDLDKDWLDGRPSYGEILDRLRETRKLPEYANFKAFRQEQVAKFVELQHPEEDSLHLPDNSTIRTITSPHPVSGLVMTFEDVTDTIALESSNKALSAVQRETLDNLFEGVVVFGPNGKVRLSNPAFAQIWHLPEEFLATKPHITDVLERCRDFYEGVENWTSFREQLVARIMMREPNNQRLVRSDGSILEYASVPLPDGGSLLSYLDVTDSAVVEQALRERSDAQHEADRLKSEFIANVSYEIRTPLTTLVGFADLLCEEYFGPLNKRQMEYAKGIHTSAEQLSSLVADILDLANIEAGQISLELDTLDIQTMLVSVLGLVKESAKRRRLSLEYDCPQDIGWMTADEKRLKQVMFNLLTNAIRYTPHGGTVTLSAKRDPYQIIFSVSDTGKGIPQADQDRIFGNFERGETHGTGKGGAGLGLTLVKRFIELHDGSVTLDSVPDKGTVITCRLPI